jgi:glycosyltransferase involved in cell wall biosynthesis
VSQPERMSTSRVPPSRTRVRWLIKGLGPGGAEHLLLAAAGKHDRSAFDMDVDYLLPWKDALVAPLARAGVPATCLEVRNEHDLRWAWRFRHRLRSEPVDILHVHSPYPAAVARLVVRSLPRSVRPRLVYTTHNNWSSFHGATRAANALTMRLDDADIVVSRDAYASIWPSLASRVELVEHGVALDAVRALKSERNVVRKELGVGGEPLVGTVANLRANKDWPNLLHAARRMLDDGSPARFVGVGQGPLESEVRELHDELQLGDRFLLLGHREDAVRVMSACDVFVLASVVEGLPVAVMEAMALGLPIVATEVGGLPEMVTAGVEGLLVPPRDSGALAAAIACVLEDDNLRSRMAEAASTRANDYDITNAVRRIEAIYRGVLGR